MPKDQTFTQRELDIIEATAEITAKKTLEEHKTSAEDEWVDKHEALRILGCKERKLLTIQKSGEITWSQGEAKNSKRYFNKQSLLDYRKNQLAGIAQFRNN